MAVCNLQGMDNPWWWQPCMFNSLCVCYGEHSQCFMAAQTALHHLHMHDLVTASQNLDFPLLRLVGECNQLMYVWPQYCDTGDYHTHATAEQPSQKGTHQDMKHRGANREEVHSVCSR